MNFFLWIGPFQRSKGLNLGNELDHAYGKNPKRFGTSTKEVCALQMFCSIGVL